MNKEELGRKISDKIKNKDSELAQKTISNITNYLSDFYRNDIKLEGHYEEVQFSSSAYMCILKVFEIELEYKLDDMRIKVTKKVKSQDEHIDEINIENGQVYCEHGEFSVKEVEKHLLDSFKDIF